MPGEIRFHLDEKGRLKLFEQLQVLTLPPSRRRWLVNRMGRQVINEARKNIRSQRTVDGASMEPRKDKRSRRKLLVRMGRGLSVKHGGDLRADVTWKNSRMARIAYQHQHGVAETWTPAKAEKVYGVPDYRDKATAAQAKSLIAEGFKRQVAKKRGRGVALRRVSQKWIRENMTLGQAGIILRLMRTKNAHGKQRWEIIPPARPFLGATPDMAGAMLTDLARQALREMNT